MRGKMTQTDTKGDPSLGARLKFKNKHGGGFIDRKRKRGGGGMGKEENRRSVDN